MAELAAFCPNTQPASTGGILSMWVVFSSFTPEEPTDPGIGALVCYIQHSSSVGADETKITFLAVS